MSDMTRETEDFGQEEDVVVGALIHFRDIHSLTQHVSHVWSSWGRERIVTDEDIAHFGELTQNPQWIHTDKDRCKKESPYGDVIAHGLFILALIPSLLPPEPFQVVGYAQRIVRGCNSFRFPAPVFPGDCVRARTKLVGVRVATSGKGTILTRKVEVRSNSGAKPVVTAELMLQYF